MTMMRKLFSHVTYYFEERDDAVAGKLNRMHDWCHVGWRGLGGFWMPRPQRWVSSQSGAGSNTFGDYMTDTTWDSLEQWSEQFGMSKDTVAGHKIRLHGFCEMPVQYQRTSAE
jgi:hypothetical protein